MSNIINFPIPVSRAVDPETEMQNARDQLLALLASLDDLNAELAVLLEKEAVNALPQNADEQIPAWLTHYADGHRPERIERQRGGT